ncbi:MAG: metallophosphoesterase [Nitrospinota bacterium]
MKVGILSDSHGNFPALLKAVELFKARGVDTAIHCGDWDAPFMMKALNRIGTRVVAVLGNCDGERVGMKKLAESFGWEFGEPPLETEIGGRRFLLLHEPRDVEQKARSGRHDVILHGHVHALPNTKNGGERVERIGSTLVINPGEAGGWVHGKATAAIVDTEPLSAEIIEITKVEPFERGLRSSATRRAEGFGRFGGAGRAS